MGWGYYYHTGQKASAGFKEEERWGVGWRGGRGRKGGAGSGLNNSLARHGANKRVQNTENTGK